MRRSVDVHRWFNSLYHQLIFVRVEPYLPIHQDVIRLYLAELGRNRPIQRESVQALAHELGQLPENGFITALLDSLESRLRLWKRYSVRRVEGSKPILAESLSKLLLKLEAERFDEARIMASAMHNFPAFVLRRYRMPAEQFWEEHIQYYARACNETFLEHRKDYFMTVYASD